MQIKSTWLFRPRAKISTTLTTMLVMCLPPKQFKSKRKSILISNKLIVSLWWGDLSTLFERSWLWFLSLSFLDYAAVRTNVVLAWSLSNAGLAIAIVNISSESARRTYMAFLLYSVAALAAFRFGGTVTYLWVSSIVYASSPSIPNSDRFNRDLSLSILNSTKRLFAGE